jgi:uncharacterized membrane protein YjgN (DUF898 family)
MNRTHFEHAGFALLMQCAVWLLTGNLLAGTLLAIGFFFGREHSQAEYKAINTDFGGKRANMPWYAGFNPKYWTLDAMLDLLAPVLVCFAFYFIQFALK